MDVPSWVSELSYDHKLREKLEEAIFEHIAGISKARQVGWSKEKILADVSELESVVTRELDLGRGRARIELNVKAEVFYEVLEEITGFAVEDEASLFSLLIELGSSKKSSTRWPLPCRRSEAKATASSGQEKKTLSWSHLSQ